MAKGIKEKKIKEISVKKPSLGKTHIKKCFFSGRTTKVLAPPPIPQWFKTTIVLHIFLSIGNGLKWIKKCQSNLNLRI